MTFDAILVVSFGGPEGPDDVEPFLGNVLRGRRVPPERVHQVAARYLELGGISPLNGHNRALVEALDDELMARSMDLPVYWGNRNWHPFLEDTVRAMAADGVRSAAAFVTSAYSSYSSCRQYLEDIERARLAVGAGAPAVVKLRPYFNHPGFIEAFASGLISARAEAGPDAPVLHERPQHPGRDGRDLRLRTPITRNGETGVRGGGRTDRRVVVGLPEPIRAADAALART